MGRRVADRVWPVALLLLPLGTVAQHKIDWTAPLPPAVAWSGRSEALIVADDDPWITPSERSGLTATPTYDETVAYLRRLAENSSVIHLLSIGKSAQGRDIIMVVATANGASTPGALKRDGKPTLLVQAGIHAGEIDGKDAGLMLLRDIAVRGIKADLLNNVNLLFIPILSVDGHERRSPYNRINQRGPEGQGWRTNSRNLNLNRDYAKLDTREVRAVVKVINQWAPDLYLDLHVTDGIDYQYDITFGHAGDYSWSPSIAGWLENYLTPALSDDLSAEGHIPGPLVFAVDNRDPAKGTREWIPSPRYSDGYGAARHLPTVLVENHSLKPYRQRVLGTYVLLESAMRTLSRYGDRLSRAVTADQSRESMRIPLDWRVTDEKSDKIEFLGVGWSSDSSEISGGRKVVWTGVPTEINLPHANTIVPTVTVRRPKAYWIPPAWDDVIDRLRMHGIYMEEMNRSRTVKVELDRFTNVTLAPAPFEGRMRVTAESTPESRSEVYPPGSVRVPTNQPLGDLAILLLEPRSPDSFFSWGFFLEILQRTEYVEGYVMEPLAERMLATDPGLKRKFEAALNSDQSLAGSPQARLQWLYRRTPYYDDRHQLYPVGREW